MHKQLAILDFGSQFTQLIARVVRELGCYCQIYCPETFCLSDKIYGIIFSGSHKSYQDYGQYNDLLQKVFTAKNIPVLGICYGKQLICNFFGAKVSSGKCAEYGRADLFLKNKSELLSGITQSTFTVWMSHGDTVEFLPKDFVAPANTADCKFAVIENVQKKIYCTQFHPEVAHTQNGKKILQNFIKICNLQNTWTLDAFSEEEKAHVIKQVGQNSVIAAVSGGVDSTVAAKFMHDAIGDKLKCIFVDTGLLRKAEAKQVQQNFKSLGIPLKTVDASLGFLSALKDVLDPEAKRKIIGNLFVEVFQKEAKKIKDAKFLLQGTLYPDVVESGKHSSDKIKSHHNVGGLPQKMNLQLIEPFALLFKDEVRKIGTLMGIGQDLLMRHPFPGPGLAVRIPDQVTQEKIHILQEVDFLYISMLKESGFYDKIWQAFAVLLPVKSVGVTGDKRRFGYACVLRAINSCDGMTANAYPFYSDAQEKLDFLQFLDKVATIIPNKIKEVSRVLYDITSKPPATIEWE